jgi:hypothetical protein
MKFVATGSLGLAATLAFTTPTLAAKPPAAPVSATATFSGDLAVSGVDITLAK